MTAAKCLNAVASGERSECGQDKLARRCRLVRTSVRDLVYKAAESLGHARYAHDWMHVPAEHKPRAFCKICGRERLMAAEQAGLNVPIVNHLHAPALGRIAGEAVVVAADQNQLAGKGLAPAADDLEQFILPRGRGVQQIAKDHHAPDAVGTRDCGEPRKITLSGQHADACIQRHALMCHGSHFAEVNISDEECARISIEHGAVGQQRECAPRRGDANWRSFRLAGGVGHSAEHGAKNTPANGCWGIRTKGWLKVRSAGLDYFSLG